MVFLMKLAFLAAAAFVVWSVVATDAFVVAVGR